MSLQLGILLALLCAFASNLAFLYKHRGACSACRRRHPPPAAHGPLAVEPALRSRSACSSASSPGCCTSARSRWPRCRSSRSCCPSGLVLLAVMADRLFGFKVGKRQWWGLGLTFVGLVLLAITLPASHGAHSAFSVSAMVAFEAGLFGLGALCIMSPRLGGRAEHHGIMLAAAAGILFGVCNLGVKALTGVVGDAGAARRPAQPVAVGRARRLGDGLLRLRALAAGRRRRRGHRDHRHRREHRDDRRRAHRLRRPAAGRHAGHRRAGRRLRARHRRLGAHARAGARRPARRRRARAPRPSRAPPATAGVARRVRTGARPLRTAASRRERLPRPALPAARARTP